jgi:hypothetical protein
MLDPEVQSLLNHDIPLRGAELRRIGVSEADATWIHAGASEAPTEAALRAEPPNANCSALMRALSNAIR